MFYGIGHVRLFEEINETIIEIFKTLSNSIFKLEARRYSGTNKILNIQTQVD